MATTVTGLGTAAELLKAHPRTVLRALTGEPNPQYNKGESEDTVISDDELCDKLRINKKIWKRVKSNRDSFLTRDDIMRMHEISVSTFKRRDYPVAAKFQRHNRYSEVECNRHRVLYHGHDLDKPVKPYGKGDDDDDLASIL